MALVEHQASTNGVTFVVDDVQVATAPLEEDTYKNAFESAIGDEQKIESCSARLTTSLVPTPYHGFFSLFEQAFDEHRPISLSPDHLWILLCQGLANHVNNNSEKLRKHFVSHEGKVSIVVIENSFVKGAMENDWERTFSTFNTKMASHLGDKASMLEPRFSTTTNIETAACQVTMMDAMKSYFRYTVVTCCGIPSITLEGKPEDWHQIVDRFDQFGAYDLGWWTREAKPVVEQFARAASGDVDKYFWKNFFSTEGGSGGPYHGGEIVKLFPYLQNFDYRSSETNIVKNPYITGEKSTGSFSGLKGNKLPAGCGKVPFTWNYYGKNFEYNFYAGFAGLKQDKDTMTLRPEIGWAVSEVVTEDPNACRLQFEPQY